MHKIVGTLPHVFGFDRVTIWVSQADIKGLDEALGPHCHSFTLTAKPMKQNSLRKAKLEILQPTKEAFLALERCLNSSVRATPNYVEPGWDIICKNPKQAASMGQWRHVSVRFKSVRTLMTKPEEYEIYYYAPRTMGEANGKTSRVPVEYSDKNSKLRSQYAGHPCSHMEMRVYGIAAVQQLGLYSLADLTQFDHVAYWRKAVEIYKMPNKTALGKMVASPRQITTDYGFRKNADRWMQKHTVAGHFAMHNACVDEGKQFWRKLAQFPEEIIFGKPRRRCLI